MRFSHGRSWLNLVVVAATIGAMAGPHSSRLCAQATLPAETDEESARQQQIVERFVTVLEKNPRRGTALDRIYGFHIENGTIESFVQRLRDRVTARPDDGAGWMILGLVESQRGRDAAAAEALTKAKDLRKTDPLAAYYLGQSLVLVGQPEKAVAAFEEAIERKPGQVDLLEIFQALGRVHQRAQRTQEAMAVWSRLEKLFPNDARVQEQIAVTLVEEGQAADALPRYEALAKSADDDYRRTVYQMEAAELKIKLNRASEGTTDLEQLLAKLNPESWLFREVRRKIEEVFLRTEDQDGLAKYYTAWLTKNPEDIEAMARLARVLARQARVPEARDWLDKALKLAPSRKELRLAFIEQLVEDQRYPDAIEQYAALDKADPNNPDYLRDWGKLILRDSSRPKDRRQAEAEKVWRRLLAARPSDALIATQVADLFRHAELETQALELYQRAVELAPMQPQYREYLGEYLHVLKRPEEAIAAWRKMADGAQRTATNVARLAEVLAQFGYLEQALPEIAAACELDPKDFSLQLKAAELQLRAESFAAALESLSRADKLAQNDEEHETVLVQQIKTYTLKDKLTEIAQQLAAEASRGGATHRQWFLLARYREVLHEFPEATKAIHEALKLQPNDIRSLAAAGRIAEQSGDLKQSADLNRKLAVVDRRGRSEYLQHVARLETQLGRIDEALVAGRELIAAAPGNVETYQFFADMCFRLGRADDGLTALRRATRVNPNEPVLLLSLAAALAGQFRTDEAIELYWQALEKHGQLDDKLNVIGKLAELYLQTNHLDQLLERLQRGQREADQRREMTICLAQAYQSAGDYGMARQELERLLSENTRDTQLLFQLSKLAEGEGDLASAVKYQEHLAKLAPGPEAEYRLATLLARAGDNQASAEILVQLAVKEDDKEKLLRNIDGLLAAEQYDTALAVLEPKLRESAADWELLYREGFALAKRRPGEAPRRFQAILELSVSDDELGIVARNRQVKQKTQPAALTTSPVAAAAATRPRPIRTDYAYEIRRAIGLDPEPYYGPTATRRPIWTPQDFGQARLAAIGWLFYFAQRESQADAFVADRKARAEAATAGPRELWDWVNLQAIRADEDALIPATRQLAEKGGTSEKLLYLMKLAARGGDLNLNSPRAIPDKDDKTPPLDAEELAFVLRIYDDVGKLPADPQSMNSYYTRAAAATVFKELSRAGRKDDEQRLYREIIDRATTVEELSSALQLAQQRRDSATFLAVFDRLAAKDLQRVEARNTGVNQVSQSVSQAIAQFVGQPELPTADVQTALDRFLAYHAAKTNQRHSSPAYRPASRSLTARQNNYVYVWSGNSQRYTQLPYPAPGEYFDQQALGVLRGVFEVFRTKDLVSDLVKHLEAYQSQVSPAEKLYPALTLAYLQVWNEDREAGVLTLTQAAELAPQDLDLRLEAARLHLEMGQFDEALAIVDAAAPLDQRTLQQREALALDLAVRLGDHHRASDAAQRLFGLRLDAETQVSLAGQMRRLGMNEESDAVLARAQRQAGSRVSALSALMGQYQAQGQMEVAAQVAHQILRRSRTAPASQTAMGYSTVDSQARRSALQCLAQAGKLKELISGLEQQIERTPQASQLYETLTEYYQAAGDSQKLLDLQAKIIALRPEDADLRYRYGQELYRRGKLKEACDEYLVVIKKQPQLLRNRYYEVIQAFQRARREPDLVRVLGEIDLRSFGQSYIVLNMLSNLMQDQQSRATAMVLFKKAWEAFPNERSNMMSSFYDPAVWKSPDVLEYGKQSLLPTAGSLRNNPWYGIYSGLSFSGDGRVNAVLHRVLDAAAGANQLGTLRDEIAAAVSEHPRWLGGPVMLAVVDLRLGKDIDVPAAMQPLVEGATTDSYQLRYARWIVAQELEAKAATKDLALKLYERAAVSDERDLNDEFQYGPSRRLVHVYKEAGRTDDARKLLLDAAYRKPIQDGNYPYRLSQKAESLVVIGGILQEMNLPVDAMRVYRELLVNPDFGDPQISMYSGRSADQFRSQARRGIEMAVKKLAENPSAEHLQAFLAPVGKQAPGAAAIDLMIAAAPAGASPLPSLDSPLVNVIRPSGLSNETAGQIEAQLTALSAQHPDDLSVQIAQTLFALKGKDSAKADAALQRLSQLTDANPLEAIPAGKRANSRQRVEAAPQIGLWLVARECLNDRARREMAEALAARAIAAAQRQLDSAELTAIMYERGKLALDAGDRAAAEKYWNEMIDLALVEPRKPRLATPQNPVRSAAPSTGVLAAPPPPGAPAGRAAAAPTPPRNGKIPATLSQFKLGASIAQAAADNNLVPLSLRAVREALSGGVPVADLPRVGGDPFAAASIRPPPTAAAGSRSDIDETVFTELAKRMWQLSLAWKQHDFPPADVCRLLEEIVFPADRPGDVLIYEQPVTNDLSNPQSIGRLLVDWSVRAGRIAELEKQIAARQGSPTDIVGGQVLLVQLAVAQRRPDKVQEQMHAILKQLETSKLTALTGLALHATAAVFGDQQLTAAAAPLLEKIISTPAPLGRSISFGPPGPYSPATTLIRHHLGRGDVATVQTQIDRFLQSRQELYARFSGDSSAFQQKVDLIWAANELARAGDLAITLPALGRSLDVTVTRDYFNPQSINTNVALWLLARQARKHAAAERYAFLRDWTLPAENRRSVRVIAGLNSGQSIPNIFVSRDGFPAEPLEPIPPAAPLSNLTLLVEAAAEAGKLGELSKAAEPLANEKIPGGEALALLVLLARRDVATAGPRLDAIAKRVKESTRPQNEPNRTGEPRAKLEWEDYLVARAALAVPELSTQARRLCELLSALGRSMNQTDLLYHLAYDLAQSALMPLSPSQRKEVTAARLTYWSDEGSAAQSHDALPPTLWVVCENHLVRHGSNGTGTLVFNRPLTGEFEFSFAGYSSPESRCGVGYGGVAHAPSYAGGPITISSASLGVQVNRPAAVENRTGWNNVRLRVSPASVRFYINDRLTYEDRSPSRTSPWLVLNAFGTWPAMKDFRLTGAPAIPREVSLVDADRLDGWNASFYREQVPNRLKRAEPELDSAVISQPQYVMNPFGEYVMVDPNAPVVFDWQAEGSVLTGRVDQSASPTAQSRLFYQRPLADGDRVTYRFLYEPGRTHVHPTLGGIAFLLEPAGVKLHWMTNINDAADPQLVDPRNSIDDPTIRRGPPQLPLKENDWNDVELAIRGDLLSIALNGEPVCERTIEPTSDRRFGLFHFKADTAVKVKSVVLRGNWAGSLTAADQNNLLATAGGDSGPALARARHALIGEKMLTTAAYDVWKHAQDMAPADRYAYLKNWVLPSQSHPTVRLQVDWTPTDAVSHDGARAAHEIGASPDKTPAMIHTGGELVSPALELVAVAQQLNKLDELATAAAVAAKEYSDQVRPLVSFGVLLALARGDNQAAIAGLTKAIEIVKTQPVETPLHDRYPEFLATYAALNSPASRDLAKTLAQEIVKDQQPPRNIGPEWARRTPHLRALANWAADKATANIPFGQTPPLAQWRPVTRSTAAERGEGFPAGAWKLAPGEATCLNGSPRAALYYAVPMVGNFEVRGQITTAANRTIRVMYGGVAVALTADAKQVVRQEVGRATDSRTPLTEKPKGWGPTVEYKLVVKDSVMTAFINGHQVHNEPLPANVDPWLAIETTTANQTGTIKNLQITGTPSIPSEIHLSTALAVEGWRADYYGERVGAATERSNAIDRNSAQAAEWTKKGEEITVARFDNSPGSFRESVLQYHRPLLEDGEVEYEFYYELGKTEVHPALDRVAFLIAPDGVKTHWLTDAQYERTDLAPGNAYPLAGSKPAPLKSGDWNHLKLILRGDEAQIIVNETEVARRKLEPTNQRTFGLFRFADASGVRVRNVVHRGNWPRALPAIAEQELAALPK